jgi:nucleotide-binding universal stress UspA family protein
MITRILVAYDGSNAAGDGFETALQLASDNKASVYVVGAARQPEDGPASRERLNDDLVAFARLGKRFGIAVDGCVLENASPPRVAELIKTQNIDHVRVPKPADGGAPAALTDLLTSAAQLTNVKVAIA